MLLASDGEGTGAFAGAGEGIGALARAEGDAAFFAGDVGGVCFSEMSMFAGPEVAKSCTVERSFSGSLAFQRLTQAGTSGCAASAAGMRRGAGFAGGGAAGAAAVTIDNVGQSKSGVQWWAPWRPDQTFESGVVSVAASTANSLGRKPLILLYLACDSGLGARGVRNIRRMETKRDAEKQSVMPAIEGLTPEYAGNASNYGLAGCLSDSHVRVPPGDSLLPDKDKVYYNEYSTLVQQQGMLQDHVRTSIYQV